MKIKHGIYILLLTFTLIPLYVFGLFMVYENDRNVEKITRENLEAISGTEILNIKNFCETRKEKLEVLANLKLVRNMINASLDQSYEVTQMDRDYLDNMLMERKNVNSFSESVSIIDKNFRVVMSTADVMPGTGSDLQYTSGQYLSGDFYVTHIINYERDGQEKRIIMAIQGIYDRDQLIGYVVEEINLSFFDKIRTEINLWQAGTLYLLDGNNNIITAGDGVEKSRKNYITTEQDRENFNRAWNSVDLDKKPSGEITYKMGRETYITYYSKIDYTNWIIMVSISISSLLKNGRTYRILMMATFLVVSLFFLLINYYLSRRLTGPIDSIVNTLKKIQEKQDYSLRVEKHSKDEIGIMIGEINELLDYIEEENLQEKEQKRQLKRKAERDSLTGVMNKRAIEEKFLDMIQAAEERGSRVAIAFVDIDDFKQFNTEYGHQAGDRVLQFVASSLIKYSGKAVGRIGGDEFVFGIDHAPGDLEEMLKQLIEALSQGFFSKEAGKIISVPCSIGMVIAKGKALSYSYMIHQADEAMYEAKAKGKNGYKIVEL